MVPANHRQLTSFTRFCACAISSSTSASMSSVLDVLLAVGELLEPHDASSI